MPECHPLGRIEGGRHLFPLRVYWEDTDAAGIVYYANYLRFIERARSDLLRAAGIDQEALRRESGLAFAVRACAIEYLKPARLDDDLEVATRRLELKGASLRLEQTVRRDGADLALAEVRIACIDGQGRARRIPAAVAGALATLLPSFERSSSPTDVGSVDNG